MTNGWKKLGWKPSDRMQSYGYHHHRIPHYDYRTTARISKNPCCFFHSLPPSSRSSPPFSLPGRLSLLVHRLPPPQRSPPRPPFNLPLFFAGQLHLQPGRTWDAQQARKLAALKPSHLPKPHRPSSTASSFVPFRRRLFPVSFCNCNFPCFARRIFISRTRVPESTAPRTVSEMSRDGINN